MNVSPFGYGVLDDSESGEKYMGIFIDGDRNGNGFCITADGTYFDGNFTDNDLNGPFRLQCLQVARTTKVI